MATQTVPSAAERFLQLADWRRRTARLFEVWREEAAEDPARATEHFRQERDRMFREHPKSPIAVEEREAFRGLDHWEYDPAYRMAARLEPLGGAGGPDPSEEADDEESEKSVALPASTSEVFRFRPVGTVALSGPLEGHQLTVYWILGYAGGFFLPFKDATSGKETYGAGRYLLDTIKSADHGLDADGRMILDFNLAFHPSCAYDARWSCPLAPAENTLPVPVPAGERLAGGTGDHG